MHASGKDYACPKCRNSEANEVRGSVARVRDIPARLILMCGSCGTVFYARDLKNDPREIANADSSGT